MIIAHKRRERDNYIYVYTDRSKDGRKTFICSAVRKCVCGGVRERVRERTSERCTTWLCEIRKSVYPGK